MAIRAKSVTLPAAAGGAGVATATITTSVEPGRLVGVRYIFAGTEAATTTVTITGLGGNRVVAKKAAGNATVQTEPTMPGFDNTGTVGTTLFNPVVGGQTKVDVAAANAGDTVTVILFLAT